MEFKAKADLDVPSGEPTNLRFDVAFPCTTDRPMIRHSTKRPDDTAAHNHR